MGLGGEEEDDEEGELEAVLGDESIMDRNREARIKERAAAAAQRLEENEDNTSVVQG